MAVPAILGGKVPVVDDVLSSHEQKNCPTTSLEENCREFEIQTHRIYYVDFRQIYFAVKLNFVKGHGCETYSTREV